MSVTVDTGVQRVRDAQAHQLALADRYETARRVIQANRVAANVAIEMISYGERSKRRNTGSPKRIADVVDTCNRALRGVVDAAKTSIELCVAQEQKLVAEERAVRLAVFRRDFAGHRLLDGCASASSSSSESSPRRETECSICRESRTETTIFPCCGERTGARVCTACVEQHVFTASDGAVRSEVGCPFCRCSYSVYEALSKRQPSPTKRKRADK